MKLVTFNVCGIKNLFGFKPWNEHKTLGAAFDHMNADIVCFQETKLQPQDLTKQWAVVEGYQSFFTFSTVKKGYSGVAIYVRNTIPVLAAEEGLSGDLITLAGKQSYRSEAVIGGYPEVAEEVGRGIDVEGRCLVLDIGECVLIGLYCPANSQGDKQEYRDLFFHMLDERVLNLRALGRKVVVLGDINVSPHACDSAEAQQRLRKANVPPSDWDSQHLEGSIARNIVWSWLEAGFIDTTRHHHPARRQMYTCWDLRVDGRGANFGSRIDLILASPDIECTGADIMLEVYGSDHCPVYADLELSIEPVENYKAPLLSRKRCAGFVGLQSFWGTAKAKVAPPAPAPATAPVPEIVAARTQELGPTKPKLAQRSFKVTKKPKAAPSVFTSIKSSPELIDSQGRAKRGSQQADSSADIWKQIFAQKKPKCLHGDDAKLQKCTKPGPNRGRSFWCCIRPKGEDNDPTFRCKYFQWS